MYIEVHDPCNTGYETMVYELYRVWNNGGLPIISMKALLPQQSDLYDPYGRYGL